MPHQNRVTPFGSLITSPARGTLMGNRGCLHDEHRTIRRAYQGKRWIICLLQFKGRQRPVMAPGQYTELFFLDEATALAAGHRPCAECQRARFNLFRETWAGANPALASTARPAAPIVDAALHRERIRSDGQKVTYQATLADLPDGTFVTFAQEADAYLVWRGTLLCWRPFGYVGAMAAAKSTPVCVLTPRSVVRVLEAGYPVAVHPSI